MPEKLIALTDAFRTVLRARYPQRPALADEIRGVRYFHSATIDKETGRYTDPEAHAAGEAHAVLIAAIASQSVRLFGRLGENMPNDIHPTEVARNGVHLFDNTLEVYGERGRTLRTYRNVHCYAAEIEALIGKASAPAHPEPLPSSRDTAEEACRKLIVSLDNSGLTKAVIYERARKAIPDLQLVEFDRAWFNGAKLLKKRGRRREAAI